MEVAEKQSKEHFRGQARLPKFAVPRRYRLNLTPDLTACTFSGTVKIELSIVQATSFIVLNALELNIDQVSFRNSVKQSYAPSEVVVDSDDEILILAFSEVLGVGDGTLEISFSADLNPNLKGFYKGTYLDGEVRKNMAATQFEAVEARRCFPCWDEPALKATFEITVNAPSELTVLSNMPVVDEVLNGDFKTSYFEESPIMSTYLVAIVVGSFDHIEETTADGIKVGVYCPVGKSNQGKFALDVGIKALDLYKRYFSMPYSLPKLDMVGAPDFPAGAMENYGLITFREIELLQDDLNSTAANKQRRAIVLLHEIAHQWFGNLVTMEWRTHLWLNEGFATWVSYLATNILFPEWEIWTQFLEETAGGLVMDALESSHPIEVEVPHARATDEIFDAISYRKGSAIVWMLMDYLGDHVIQKSLSSYMKRYAFGNAKTEGLWSVLSEESGVPVHIVMDAWTKKKNYPVISVTLEDHYLIFEQSQFLYSGSPSDDCWIIPITSFFGSCNKTKRFLLETKLEKLDISELNDSSDGNMENCQINEHFWVKINFGQSGFYRVKYDEKLTATLRKAIEDNCLSVIDRFGVLDDTYALCQACQLSVSSLLSLINLYRTDFDYTVLSKLINVCSNLAKVASDTDPNLVDGMKQFFIHLLLTSAEKLGWEPIQGENDQSEMSRGEVLEALVKFGHESTIEEALKRFQAYLDDQSTPLLPVGSRKAAYIAVTRNASVDNRRGFESLLKLYKEAQAVQEKARILRCIASCPQTDIVLEVLGFIMSDEVRSQDVQYALSGMSFEGRETAWTWLQANWDLILEKSGAAFQLHSYIRNIVTPFCSHEKADEVEAFFATRVTPAFAMNLRQSLEQVRIKARWVEHIKKENSLAELLRELACTG